jgi:hypothetical protein
MAKPKLDKNGLRTPTPKEIEENGLPKSYDEAIEQGVNQYEKDGVGYKIRFKSRAKPDRYGKQKEIEQTSLWRKRGKDTQPGRRLEGERRTTPNRTARREANVKMSNLRDQGRVGHHVFGVMEMAHGQEAAFEKGGFVRESQHVDRYQKANPEQLSRGVHSPENIQGMDIPVHDDYHNVQEKARRRAISSAGQEPQQILFGWMKNAAQALGYSQPTSKPKPKPKPKPKANVSPDGMVNVASALGYDPTSYIPRGRTSPIAEGGLDGNMLPIAIP